jgi:hypothetical protein
MKIKHKQSGVQLTVKEEQAPFKAYWTTDGGSYIHKDDPEWELVKEEEWEDVTEECDAGRYARNAFDPESSCHALNNNLYLAIKGVRIIHLDGYRLRKIDGLHNGPAFIVERRKA